MSLLFLILNYCFSVVFYVFSCFLCFWYIHVYNSCFDYLKIFWRRSKFLSCPQYGKWCWGLLKKHRFGHAIARVFGSVHCSNYAQECTQSYFYTAKKVCDRLDGEDLRIECGTTQAEKDSYSVLTLDPFFTPKMWLWFKRFVTKQSVLSNQKPKY